MVISEGHGTAYVDDRGSIELKSARVITGHVESVAGCRWWLEETCIGLVVVSVNLDHRVFVAADLGSRVSDVLFKELHVSLS